MMHDLKAKHTRYRPEIDGLRALAVMLVILFHLDFPVVSGGYIGVDIFFVISGYLITRLILTELEESGSFDFKNFYLRRMRRLLPAFIATLFASSVVSFLILPAGQFKSFAETAIASVLSVSNFLFWQKTSYFDSLANTKPLLHTWSLSVEEQFYLLWPAVAYFLYTKFNPRALPFFLVFVCICSVLIAEYWLVHDREAAFYLLPSRAIELGIGSLIVWIEKYRTPGALLSEIVSGFGILLMLLAATFFSEATPFPGVMSLLPCIGAAMFIYAGSSRIVSRPFALLPIVWLGRISYSLYLVHWPILVFAIAWFYREFSLIEKLALLITIFAVAILQYWSVESRFRQMGKTNAKNFYFVMTIAGCALIIVTQSMYTAAHAGLLWRVPRDRQLPTMSQMRKTESKYYCENWNSKLDRKLFTCQNNRGKQKDLFIWGDSHARHLVAGFSEAYPDHNIFVLYMSGCAPQSGFSDYKHLFGNKQTEACVDRNLKALKYFLDHPKSNVIITSSKVSTPRVIARATRMMTTMLQQTGTMAVVLGDFIRPGISLRDCVSVPDYLASDKHIRSRCVGIQSVVDRELKYNADYKREFEEMINPERLQCIAGHCKFIDNGILLFMDDHHFNVDGSIFFVNKLKSMLPFK